MAAVALPIQTLYADLLQQVETAGPDEGTVVATTVRGIRYLRRQRWVGTRRVIDHLGRADDPAIQARADAIRAGMRRRRERRKLVSMLKPPFGGPGRDMAPILDVVADAGLFVAGAVLVGTGAYVCYPPLVGARLPSSSLMTQDADLAISNLKIAGVSGSISLESILRVADPSFSAIPGLDPRRPPSRFRSDAGFVVDLLAQQRSRADRDPVDLPGLQAGATLVQHLEWLIRDPASAVALSGAGTLVAVPQPARYAVHKLVIAQKRPAGQQAKRAKDLVQANALMAALQQSDPFALDDAMDDARSQGKDGWAKPIDRSLWELSRLA